MIAFHLTPTFIRGLLVYGMLGSPWHRLFLSLRDDASTGDDSTPHSWEP